MVIRILRKSYDRSGPSHITSYYFVDIVPTGVNSTYPGIIKSKRFLEWL